MKTKIAQTIQDHPECENFSFNTEIVNGYYDERHIEARLEAARPFTAEETVTFEREQKRQAEYERVQYERLKQKFETK